MTRRCLLAVAAFALIIGLSNPARAAGDARRGAQQYRACVACHSLEPASHMTGPSLAGLWGRKAGVVDGFARYSQGLKSMDITWDEHTLNAWLADPRAMVPDTYMVFRGIDNDQARADLIAFLALAMASGGDKAVIDQKLVPAQYARGPVPDPLRSAPAEAQVTAVRHCGDSYFVKTANGSETPYWEMNVRLKLDTRATGPEPEKPVVLRAGMQGDRVSVVFSSLAELSRFVVEKCEP